MRLVIRGHRLPGRTCGPHANIHVGLQIRQDPVDLVPADAVSAQWVTNLRTDNGDFHGPAVHGRRGERFVYLTWGTVEADSFTMFRRAKVMLDGLPGDAEQITLDLDLTDESGMPRCARVQPTTITVGP
ncbi:DUF5990 family protein [Ornithinimicrobium faecis]|uniref:DUF5990 family protein n=1 Tax=Ornithinimicrobium faecis TaxID=2934158 RepID=UPI002118639B|nr:DUF5990 family protein [Ornithinimicrobium sp. HY1745]